MLTPHHISQKSQGQDAIYLGLVFFEKIFVRVKIFSKNVREKKCVAPLCSFNKKTGQKPETKNQKKGVFSNQKLHTVFVKEIWREKWAKMYKKQENFLAKQDLMGKCNLLSDFFEKNKCQNDDFARKGEKVKTPKRYQRADLDLWGLLDFFAII